MALANVLSLNFLVPFVASKISFARAIRGLTGMPRRLLLAGHKLPAGALAVNTITTISTETDAIAALGEGSQLLEMWRAAKANVGAGLPIDVIAINTAAGAVAAASTIIVTNTGANLTANGEVMLYIGGVRISSGVTTSDTAASVATKLNNAINANTKLPVIATNLTPGQIVLTAKWAGPSGNDIDVRTTYYADDALPPSLSFAPPAMSGGAGAPDVSPVIVAMSLYRATEIVSPFTDSANMGAFENELAARWGANNMQDGMLCTAIRGTEATIGTWLSTRNSPHVHTICTTNDATSPWATAAMAAAAIEQSASIDPAQGPIAQLVGYKGPARGQGFLSDSINNLLLKGGSALAIALDYSGSLLRMVTNYKTSNAGAPDRSMAEMCWLKTMSYYRWFQVTTFQNQYNNQGYKLAQYVTQPLPGQKLMTLDLAGEIMVNMYKLFCDAGLCQNPAYYASVLRVEIDAPNGKLKIIDEPVIVTQHYQTEITSNVVAGQI